MKKIFSLGAVMLGVMALVCTSCEKKTTETTLTIPATATVNVGESTTITATITPEVSGATVAWSSSNATIAAATGDGQTCIITGVSAGSAVISATYNGKTAQCVVTVTEPGVQYTITVPETATVKVGASTVIAATIAPAVTGATVQFSSSDPAVATVNGILQSCTITGVSEGTATIVATYGSATASCVVTVQAGGGSEYPVLQGEDYFAIFMDGTTAGSLGNKVKYNFYTNDENRWLYVWENTFVGADPSGNNPFDLPEGWICMKQSATAGWAGCGFCFAINGTAGEYQEAADQDLVALNSLATTITDYSKWDLVIAMKKAQRGVAYDCNLIGGNMGGTESGVGTVTITDTNCPADDEWHIISFPLNEITGLEFGQWNNYGSNLFTIVANPYVANGDLNLGAAFIYRAR